MILPNCDMAYLNLSRAKGEVDNFVGRIGGGVKAGFRPEFCASQIPICSQARAKVPPRLRLVDPHSSLT